MTLSASPTPEPDLPALPFRLGSTSYVYPGDLVFNAERLPGLARDMELVLFDLPTGESNLPDTATVERLAATGAAHDLSYTVHLPHDLRGDSAGQVSRDVAARVIETTAPLAPYAYVFHLDGRDVDQPSWLDQALRAVEALTHMGASPDRLALENLENYAPEALLPVFEAFPIRRTLDVGHLWRVGRDPLPLMADWLPQARVVHLHGMAERDHVSLDVMPPDRLDPVVTRLLDWDGVLTLEVFEQDFFTSRSALLASVARVRSAQEARP